MELQTILVLCGTGVTVIAVLLLAGLFSTTGTSYEEAVAQQRKATTELLALASNKNKPKKTKKANKKLAKKEKKETISAGSTVSDQESETQADSGADEESGQIKHHVEFIPAVVVDVATDCLSTNKIRKRGKDPKVKPILINKGDSSCVNDPNTPLPSATTITNHFEETHPKDEFELLHSTHGTDKGDKKDESIEKKEVKPKSAKLTKAAKIAPAVETGKEDVTPRDRHNSGDAKDQRKTKKVDKKIITETAMPEEVVPPLNVPEPSELTTEKLLKQALVTSVQTPVPALAIPAKGKKKKPELNALSLMAAAAGDGGGVNVGELVRLVSEASLSRNEIQILTDALLNKQHDQLPQHSEWSEGPNDPMQKLKKQLADKEKALADEMEASQALHAKLKELRSSLNAERSRASTVTRTAEENAATQRAELHTLQTRLQRLLDDNHAMAQEKMILQSKLSSEAEVQAQRVQMEMHIQRLSDAEAALLQQLSALQAELNGRAHEAGQARCEANAARDSALMAQQHAADLTQQLQDATRVCSELDSQRQNALHAEQVAQQELRQAQERLNAVSELQLEVQRLTNRAQQAETNAEKVKEELEAQKKQLLSELTSLREESTARDGELSELRQLKASPSLNGIQASDNKLNTELSKVEGVIDSLCGDLQTAQTAIQSQKEQLDTANEQLRLYKEKNNEAVTKALTAQYVEVASILKTVMPTFAVPTTPNSSWLQSFASKLKQELAKENRILPETTTSTDGQLDELRAQKKHLQGVVDKYKTIIDDTEGVLSSLQQNVTSEEARWAKQLAEKQLELDELRQHTMKQMQNKIDSLQEELRHSQGSKQNHSFTDSERSSEETTRLSNLTGKHKIDPLNGPL